MSDELILLANTRQPRASVLVNKHLEGYATLQFAQNIEGTMVLGYDDNLSYHSEGDWFFPAHPGPLVRFHSLEPGGHWFHRHVGFSGPLVEKWRASGIWLEKPQRAPGDGTDWAARMDEIIDLARDGQPLSARRAANRIEGLLLDLAAHREVVAPNVWLERVLTELESATSIAQVAGKMSLSETALRRKFRAQTGMTMQEWVLNARVGQAKTLLSDSDLPLKAIAAKLGYANEYFFSRQFKERAGVSPGAFRKSRLRF